MRLFLCIFYLFKILLRGVSAADPCIIFDKNGNQCFCCGFEYHDDEYWAEKNSPFSPGQCTPKMDLSVQLQVYVSTEANCTALSSCDGSTEKPFDSLEKALDLANEIANKRKTSTIDIIILSLSRVTYFHGSEGRIYFRRAGIHLSVRAGTCREFPGAAGCLEQQAKIKIVLKTAEIKFFVSDFLSLENLTFDAGDLILAPEEACVAAKSNKTCCSEDQINGLYDSAANKCGIKGRKMDDVTALGQRGYFNLEQIHDNSAKNVPLLYLKNIKFVNFHPFGAAGIFYESLISLVENLEGKVFLEEVQITNCSFSVGVLSYSSRSFFGKFGTALVPAFTTGPSDLGIYFSRVSLENYNSQRMEMRMREPLFDLRTYKGSIEFRNCYVNNAFLSAHSFFTISKPGSSLGVSFQNFTLRYSSFFTLLFSDRESPDFKVTIANANFVENSISSYIWLSQTPYLVLDSVLFIGQLPEFAFVVVESATVFMRGSVFSSMYNRYADECYMFISLSEYPISLSDQFYDASITREPIAKDNFYFFNSNVSDSKCVFTFLTCAHSLREIYIEQVNFRNLSMKNLNSDFLFAPAEKNFTIVSSSFKDFQLASTLIHLQPCMRFLFDKVLFLSIRNDDNHFLFFETRTVLSKNYHIFGLNNVTFEDILLTFDTPEIEAKSRYFIFSEYRSMGDGGSFFITNARFKNLSFQKDFADNKLLFISCVYFRMQDVRIEAASNGTILHHRITTSYATFEVSDVNFANGFEAPVRCFINTESEYIFEAVIRNCSLRATKLTGGNLVALNNIRTLRMSKNFFKGAASDGSLLFLRVEALIKFLMSDNEFEGIPELKISTVGIRYGSNSKSGQVNSSLFGITNSKFKNLLGSAVVISEKSELSLSNCVFSNIFSDYGALMTIKSNSLVSLGNFDARNLRAALEGGAINILASVLFVISGNLSSCSSGGLGGAIYSLESTVHLQTIAFSLSQGLSGGLIFAETSSVMVISALITNSSARGYGGCIFAKFGELNLRDIIIKNAAANERGGSIYADGSLLKLKNVTSKNQSSMILGQS